MDNHESKETLEELLRSDVVDTPTLSLPLNEITDETIEHYCSTCADSKLDSEDMKRYQQTELEKNLKNRIAFWVEAFIPRHKATERGFFPRQCWEGSGGLESPFERYSTFKARYFVAKVLRIEQQNYIAKKNKKPEDIAHFMGSDMFREVVIELIENFQSEAKHPAKNYDQLEYLIGKAAADKDNEDAERRELVEEDQKEEPTQNYRKFIGPSNQINDALKTIDGSSGKSGSLWINYNANLEEIASFYVNAAKRFFEDLKTKKLNDFLVRYINYNVALIKHKRIFENGTHGQNLAAQLASDAGLSTISPAKTEDEIIGEICSNLGKKLKGYSAASFSPDSIFFKNDAGEVIDYGGVSPILTPSGSPAPIPAGNKDKDGFAIDNQGRIIWGDKSNRNLAVKIMTRAYHLPDYKHLRPHHFSGSGSNMGRNFIPLLNHFDSNTIDGFIKFFKEDYGITVKRSKPKKAVHRGTFGELSKPSEQKEPKEEKKPKRMDVLDDFWIEKVDKFKLDEYGKVDPGKESYIDSFLDKEIDYDPNDGMALARDIWDLNSRMKNYIPVKKEEKKKEPAEEQAPPKAPGGQPAAEPPEEKKKRILDFFVNTKANIMEYFDWCSNVKPEKKEFFRQLGKQYLIRLLALNAPQNRTRLNAFMKIIGMRAINMESYLQKNVGFGLPDANYVRLRFYDAKKGSAELQKNYIGYLKSMINSLDVLFGSPQLNYQQAQQQKPQLPKESPKLTLLETYKRPAKDKEGNEILEYYKNVEGVWDDRKRKYIQKESSEVITEVQPQDLDVSRFGGDAS